MNQPPTPSGATRGPSGRRTRSGWVLGTVGRIPVVVAPSWLLIAAVLVLIFFPTASSVVRSPLAAGLTTVGFVLMLFVSVLVHELAHGLSAQRVGAAPREYVITFWGGHTAFEREMGSPGASAVVSAAGPAANLVLAGLAWFGLGVAGDGLPAPVWLVLWGAVAANLLVGAFNLLPGTPLDGGRVLEAAVWRLTGDRLRGTVAAAWGGRLVVLAVLGLFLVRPLLQGARPGLTTVVWVLLLAGLLWNGAEQSLRQARAQRAVSDLDLRELALPAVALPAGRTVADLDAVPGGTTAVVLTEAGRPTAVVDAAAARAVPSDRRAGTRLAAVAQALGPGSVVSELSGPAGVAAAARAARAGQVVVLVDGGTVVGVLPLDRLLAELDRRDPRRRRG